MKMRKSEHFTRSSASIQGQEFNVKFTDKMFQTLFSSLYRYKEAAALRETLCNAIDSHNMRDRQQRVMPSHYAPLTPPPQRFSKYLAPKGTRVIVHLPDDLEPWLEIKDFGTGLTIEQMIGDVIPAKDDEVLITGNVVVKEDEIPESAEVIGVPDFYEGRLIFRRENGEIIRSPGLYTTLFNSTKENDDEQIGAFGLGSKSPFAVSDTFTVESRVDGQVHRYLMYLNANRIPTADLLTKDPETRDPKPDTTDEYNGLTVKVPVKNSRFYSFSEELQRLGRVIEAKDRPIVENAPHYFQWININRNNRVRNTYIQEKNSNEQTHFAVMGGVSYPIDLEQLDEETRNIMSRLNSSYTFFELGSLNVPPSREDLSYDEFTRESLSVEFDLMTKSVLESKTADLLLAQKMGPLALYIEKSKISDMFGTGLRKLLDAKFPPDTRLSARDGFVYEIPISVKHDLTSASSSPYNTIPYPYDVEIHGNAYGSPETKITVNHLAQWAKGEKRVLLLIEDTTRARNLKLKALKDEYDHVVVVSPSEYYLARRNMSLDQPAFLNSKELHDYFCSWIGNQSTVDYLAFADKFCEVTGDVFSPTDVKFMSEIKYVSPPVEKEPGLYPFEGSYFDLSKCNELTADEVSKIIDNGKRIVYIEISGNHPVHEYRGKVITENAARDIRDLMKHLPFGNENESLLFVKENESLFKFMNIYPKVMLARRKSIPMMKKFPEVFIPIDQIIDMMIERLRGVLEFSNARRSLNVGHMAKRALARMQYGNDLLERADAPEKSRYQTQMKRMQGIVESLDSVLTPKVRQDMRKIIRKNKSSIQERRCLTVLMKIITEHLGLPMTVIGTDKKISRANDLIPQVYKLAMDSLKSAHFEAPPLDRTFRRVSRAGNRRRLEKYLIVQFLKQNYKPTMLNPSEDADVVIETISKGILRP